MATQVASERVYNFSAGPAVLPVPVLEQIRDEMLCLPGAGASVMELSHRSKAFVAIQQDAKDRISRLLGVGDNHEVLFLQGGSRLQFSMIPMNLLRGQATPACAAGDARESCRRDWAETARGARGRGCRP